MSEFERGDGTVVVGITLPIPPYGSALILGADKSAASEAVLQELESNWKVLWPEILKQLKDGMENLDIDLDLGDEEFVATATRTEEGKFMSDKSDIYLSLNVGDPPPDWDYFIRGSEIVHFQPVF